MAARILLVDDNAALIDNLRDILEGATELDAEVSTALDGQAAVAWAKKHVFDVAIVDVKLPDGSGVDVVRALRAASPMGEVVLITGFATVDSALAALQAGAFAFLLKSFRPEELISTVEQAFAKVSLKREREELERRQRALIETAGVLIVAVDRESRVVLHNPKVEELTTHGNPVASGKPFLASWIAEEGRERMEQALGKARAGQRSVAVECGFVDGAKTRRVEWHLSAVPADDGGSDLVYGIGVDVTERRALEKRAAEAEALSAMGTLALGLAHEIRNPLNAAVLQLHLLGRAIDRLDVENKGAMRDRVTIVDAEIGRLGRLLTEFLELARPRGPQIAGVDLAKVVEGVLALEGEALAASGISVTTVLEPAAAVAADPEKVKQVLINLVANARDALRSGGALTVRVTGGDCPRVEVNDDGPGIEASVLESVFDPFFTTKPAGTGLGLAIVRKIVDQHGGTITIDSAPGAGTRVAVELPRWTGPHAKSAAVTR